MLLIFEAETGVAGACVLSSGIPIILVVVVHSLVKASLGAKRRHGDHLDTLYQNNHGSSSSGAAVSRPCELKIGVDKPRMHRSQSHLHQSQSHLHQAQSHLQHYSHGGNPRQREQQYSPDGSHASDKEGYGSGGSYPRMHRTLSTESALLQAQAKPWNGVNNEMRSVLARKSGISAKDSTLVWNSRSYTKTFNFMFQRKMFMFSSISVLN